ncbi:MAG: ECF-type sigma factor [Bacteroidota bacterium]
MDEPNQPHTNSLHLETYFPKAYQELKRLAFYQLRSERSDHTLNATALVHEVFIKLAKQDQQKFQSKGHFFSIASRSMRRILVSYARQKKSEKRGGDKVVLTLENQEVSHMTTYEDILHLNETLDQYKTLSERGAKIIEFWFFGGFKQEEIAQIMDISESTVRREWRLARTWLSTQLKDLG